MTTSAILLSNLDVNGILRLTLNDVARRNALSEAMLAELGTAFADVGADPKVRVIVLAANGPAFCAGHDLKEMTAGRAQEDGGKSLFCTCHGDVRRRDARHRELPQTRDRGSDWRGHGRRLPAGCKL